jgi:predicted Zn finger-like uncharacterized protein
MILTCPNCGTQYVVKDGAVPPQGRQVRCASCKHSWHQDPEPAAELTLHEEAEGGPIPEDSHETIAEAAMIDPSTGPEAEERAYEESIVEETAGDPVAAAEAEVAYPPVDMTAGFVADYDAPPVPEAQPDDDFSPFAERDYDEPQRRSPVLAVLIVLIVIAAAAAAFWFFAPVEWKHRLGLADAGTTPLTLVTTHMDRQKLASGNELLTVAGRVVNPTTTSHAVPPIYARLKTKTGQVIYSWTIAPPAPTLAPGTSASFNSAEVNVPSGGDELTISLGDPRA